MGMLREFLRLEAAGGIILILAAAAAMILANSPLEWLYDELLDTPVEVRVGALHLAKPLILWINDGLMAVFFFLVGLEIKRELLTGHLSSFNQAAFPATAAVGGMAIPAAVYVLINLGSPETLSGWAIPAATDIAFALGILSLLGNRVPASLKIFLLALAIIDDLGAIVIIAVFYTVDLSVDALVIAAVCVTTLFGLALFRVRRIAPYILVGIVLWIAVLKSGVHATLAGVVLAFFIPMRSGEEEGTSPLEHLEHMLHPWVAFLVMPVFAFGNAGVSFDDMSLADMFGPVPLGIALGLFIGKQIGVFGTAWAAVKFGICRMPSDLNWPLLYGVSLLTGVGFTMSLFIGTLAFDDTVGQAAGLRLGVLAGSILSAVCGYLVLRFAANRRSATEPAPSVSEENPTQA